jgi:nucleotide-binding universal stress UspA family protein
MQGLKILFPTDFSELSITALTKLIPVLQKSNAHLVLLHAAKHTKSAESNDRVRIEERFAKFEAACSGLKKISYEKRWAFGVSADLIVAESDRVEIDMILMATAGAHGLNAIWGTKTEVVVKKAQVPILVLPDGADLDQIAKIALAADFEQAIAPARLRMLKRLVRYFEAAIEVVSINREENDFSRTEKRHRKELRYQLEEFEPQFINYRQEKSVPESLLNYAIEHKLDLITILPHREDFLGGLFHEKLSQKMVNQSTRPLLIL